MGVQVFDRDGAAPVASRRYELRGVQELDRWSLLRIPIGVVSFVVSMGVVFAIVFQLNASFLPVQLIVGAAVVLAVLVARKVLSWIPQPPAVYVTLTAAEVSVRRADAEERFANHGLTEVASGINRLEVRSPDGKTHTLPNTVQAATNAPHATRGAAAFTATRTTLVVKEGSVRLLGIDAEYDVALTDTVARSRIAPW